MSKEIRVGPKISESNARVHADLTNPYYCDWLQFLEESDSWTAAQIADYQLEQLQKVVLHSYENCPAYRSIFDREGITPADIKSLDSIEKVPFVTKEDFRDGLEEFSCQWPDREYVTTGGSTGIPFGFYRDDIAFSRELASKAHQYHRIGWKEGNRQLVLRGLPIETPDHMTYVPEFEELRCSSYHLTSPVMETFYRRALEYGPKWLRCYPSSGYIFARFLDERGWKIPSIEGVLCASENLYEFQRKLLQKVFGEKVYSHYGHYELAVLAGYCELAPTYHVLPQYGYAELLDPRGKRVQAPGEIGEIVATSFLMYATPMIRYRTRDYAVFKSYGCAECGRPYEVWDRIEGRLQEFVITETGRLISMTAINMHDSTFSCVRQFQFHQTARGKVTLNYVPGPTCDESSLIFLRSRLMEKLGTDVTLDLTPVNEIPLTARGKHRFLIQGLQVEFHDA
jgi:phenylacetate-CoA ligase